MAKVREYEINGRKYLEIECPACGIGHDIPLSGSPKWNWNGDCNNPTITPSIHVLHRDGVKRCHSFIRNGKWQFLNDCEHNMAGKTVDMVELDD